jgi:hypothetical protein
MTDQPDRARSAAALRAYATDVAAGHAPQPTLDWVRIDGHWCQQVPRRLHDLLCAAPAGDAAGLIDCERCGLVYPADREPVAGPGTRPPAPPAGQTPDPGADRTTGKPTGPEPSSLSGPGPRPGTASPANRR